MNHMLLLFIPMFNSVFRCKLLINIETTKLFPVLKFPLYYLNYI